MILVADSGSSKTDWLLYLENQELKADMTKKINESVQFNNLKKMLQTKNDQLKLFRTK